uniref:Uncharacterized protein n=1 Tax=Bradyrhizobium amphicarpaeae TaxID=1404768 RepID=A0A2U8Q1Q0_9BRAD|nr:hypothetical protein CIT40_30720 [Bradyrhizobium amphicarpaeae]
MICANLRRAFAGAAQQGPAPILEVAPARRHGLAALSLQLLEERFEPIKRRFFLLGRERLGGVVGPAAVVDSSSRPALAELGLEAILAILRARSRLSQSF